MKEFARSEINPKKTGKVVASCAKLAFIVSSAAMVFCFVLVGVSNFH